MNEFNTPTGTDHRRTQGLAVANRDGDGAQRVAFSPVWEKARAWLRDKLSQLPVAVEQDEAGNFMGNLAGESNERYFSAVTSIRCRTAAGWTVAWA